MVSSYPTGVMVEDIKDGKIEKCYSCVDRIERNPGVIQGVFEPTEDCEA